MSDTSETIGIQLPAGVHPLDASVPFDRVAFGDTPGPVDAARPNHPSESWDKTNAKALPVNQRAANSCSMRTVILNGEAIQIVGRRVGRKLVRILPPVESGAYIGATQGEVQAAFYNLGLFIGCSALPLSPNLTVPIDFPTEGPLWAINATIGTPSLLSIVEFFDLDGSLGAD